MRLYPAAFFACHRSHSGEARLTPRQWQLLAHLDRRTPTRPTDLTRHLAVSAATVSVSLDRLEREGFVERVRDPEDGRAFLVRLTAAGDEAMLEASTLDPISVAELLAVMTPEEREVVGNGLRALAAAAGRLPEGTR